jgi:hypothetical protein
MVKGFEFSMKIRGFTAGLFLPATAGAKSIGAKSMSMSISPLLCRREIEPAAAAASGAGLEGDQDDGGGVFWFCFAGLAVLCALLDWTDPTSHYE